MQVALRCSAVLDRFTMLHGACVLAALNLGEVYKSMKAA